MESYYGPIEIGLVFGSALIFMIYELIAVRRSLRESAAKKSQTTATPNPGNAPL